MSLRQYQKKRKFDKTSEPRGGDKRFAISDKLIFVIHDHYAKHHHHDLRLEMGGVLKSWAVPKLTPLEPGVKRLAVQVEDHPFEYASFSGIIPEGLYGAGKVKIFDKGRYKLRTSNSKMGTKEENLEFELFGQKVKGIYHLIRFKGNPRNWLLFKK